MRSHSGSVSGSPVPDLFSDISFYTPVSSKVTVDSLRVRKKVFAHDLLVVTIPYGRNRTSRYDEGTPISATFGYLPSPATNFFGYVHHTEPYVPQNPTPGQAEMIKVVCLGASYVMKNALMESWQQRNSSSIVRELVRRFGFSGMVQESEDALASSTCNGQTAWQYLSKLAKDLGWILYASLTDVTFKDPLSGLQDLMDTAPTLVQSGATGNIRSFTAVDGELADAGGVKADRTMYGLDPRSLQQYGVSNDTSQFVTDQLGATSLNPLFQRFVTGPATDVGTAFSALDSVQEQNRWHIQAMIEVNGDPRLRQGMLVYLDQVPVRERGFWFVQEADHHISGGVYRTVLNLGRDSRFARGSVPPGPGVRRIVRQRFDPFGQQKAQVPASLLVNGRWRAEYGAERGVPGVA